MGLSHNGRIQSELFCVSLIDAELIVGSNMCHHCARCYRARDTQNRSGLAD